ncbi:hypothetical protein CFP56_039635 [Quercus suber]|uniref:Uncharacterized protein n=1 Tax=Quercus suber TaxID=58331 RepID=A0AAW0MBZ4_QUESU
MVVFSIPESTLLTSKSLSNPQITMAVAAATVVAASEPSGSSTTSMPSFFPVVFIWEQTLCSIFGCLEKNCIFVVRSSKYW